MSNMGLLHSGGESHGISEETELNVPGAETAGATNQTQSSVHYKGQSLTALLPQHRLMLSFLVDFRS